MRHRTSSTTAKKQTLADQISLFSVRGDNLKNSDQTPNDDDIEEGRYQKEGKRPHPIRVHSQQYRV